MTSTTRPNHTRWRTVIWWAGTLVSLILLDDLLVGPAFWLISRTVGPAAAVAAILAIYIPGQIYIVRRGTADSPGRVAEFFLTRLELHRRNDHIREIEGRLRDNVTSTLSASAMSLVLGGVIPPMTLWKLGYSRTYVRRISILTAIIYAAEFALLHGLFPSVI